MESQKEYYAFISYKREDEKWAKWLQDKLEHYRFPTNLNGRTDLPKNIRPTFRDVTDLSPEPLEQAISNALLNSEWLIVVCSPRSARSPWVCKEAQTFIDLGRADHIIPFVIEGNPFSADTATECYPEALLKLTGCKELLAANINEMGRDAAAIKVVARMFNLRFDALWQRYEREQRRKRWMWIGGSILFALLSFGIGGYFVKQNTIIENANRKVLENQGRFVAKQMESVIDEGDLYTALLVGIEMLTQDDRPYVPQIEIALRRAYDSICAVGLHPVSVLKYTMSEPYGTGRPSLVSFSSDSKHIQIAYEWDLEGTDMPICEYSSLTGELIKEKLVDFVCEDSMETTGYRKSININNDCEELWSPDKSYMLKVYDNRCVIYKKNHSPNYIKYPVGGCGNLEKNVISKDSKYAIFGDSIYNFLSGKSVRPLATSFSHDWAAFTPDDKYIVTLSEYGSNDSIGVEDFQTKKILSKIRTSEYAMPPSFDKNGNLFVPVWEDSFYVYRIPSLEIVDRGIIKNGREGYDINVQGKDVILLLDGKNVQTLKDILPEEPINTDYVGFEMLDNNKKILITYVYECMLWDLNKKTLLNRWFFGNNRYGGLEFNNNRSQMLAYNGFEITIYDTNSGLLLLDKTPSEDCLSYDTYGGTYSSDERYIVHYVCNNGADECNTWDSMVYIYEFLPIEELISKCRECIGNRKLTHKERVDFYLD